MGKVCGCGQVAVPVAYNIDGTEIVLTALCAECSHRADDEFELLRAQYQDLIERGVHPRMADHIMCARVARLGERYDAS